MTYASTNLVQNIDTIPTYDTVRVCTNHLLNQAVVVGSCSTSGALIV